jgi:hypothetical protein
VALESCTNLQSGFWRTEAEQDVAGGGNVSVQLDRAEPVEFFRARSKTPSPLSSRVNACMSLIRAAYGEVPLYSVQAQCTGSTTDPNALGLVKVSCPLTNNHTVTVESPVPDVFGPITESPYPTIGVSAFVWPVNIDVNEADYWLKAAGKTGTYTSIGLYWPVSPGMDEPYYIFTMSTQQSIFVGANSRRVLTTPGMP